MIKNNFSKKHEYSEMKIKLSVLLILVLMLPLVIFAQSQPLKKVNFLSMWIPQPQFAGYYMAKEKGIYEKYGLDVNIINGGYNKDVTEYLKDGAADIGILYLSAAVKERSENTPLVNIGQIFQRSEIMYVAKKKSGIDSLKDFSGKKIAIWRTILTELTTGFLNEHNIQAEVIRINEGVNLFLKDAVEICAVMHYNEYNSLFNYGINPDELNIFYFKDYGMNFPEDGIYCLQKTYDNDPDLCKNFTDASIEGWNYALSNPEETLSVLEKYQKLDNVQITKAHSQWMLQCMKDVIQPPGKEVEIGELLVEDYKNMVDFLIKNKFISNVPEYSKFFQRHRTK
jgi:NitT/TauT family transport system substrate-binding protein